MGRLCVVCSMRCVIWLWKRRVSASQHQHTLQRRVYLLTATPVLQTVKLPMLALTTLRLVALNIHVDASLGRSAAATVDVPIMVPIHQQHAWLLHSCCSSVYLSISLVLYACEDCCQHWQDGESHSACIACLVLHRMNLSAGISKKLK